MRHRGDFPAEERQARSRIMQIVRQKKFIRAGVVKMARQCGKVNCRCATGQRHVSYYLSTREGKKRKMIYIPTSMEGEVREWVKNYKEINKSIDQISACCLQRMRQE